MKYILNGTDVTPDNILTIGLNSDFTGRPSELELSADKLIMKREAVDVIRAWLAVNGPIHGIPLQIISNSGVVLEYYVDLMDRVTYKDYSIEVPIKRRKGKDQFFDNADGTSFELMASKGTIFSLVDVPYIIVKDNAVELALTLGVSIYVLTKDLVDQIVAFSETITQIIDAVTPQTGTGVTYSIGQIATLIIKALVQLVIIGLLLTALIKMSQQFFELIFPKVRYFQACKVKELIQKGCVFLGYSLSSNLLDSISNATILPVPLVKDKGSFWDFIENDLNFAYTKGYPTAQDTTPTLGSLIRAIETQYNAKTRVVNGVVEIERRDHWINIIQNQVVPALNLQEERQNGFMYNTEEAWKRSYIHYRTDPSDLNTLDFFDPTDAEYSTEPTNIPNADLVLIKGSNDIPIPFALGIRKNKLNWIENLAKEFFEVVDEVAAAFGGATNYSGTIANRVGVLQISQQFYTVTKFLWTIGGKQPENYEQSISAPVIYNGYHVIDEINNNDYEIFEDAPVAMNEENFVNLVNYNYAEIDGKNCEILTIQYFEEQSLGIISYKSPSDWANGKTQVITINA